MIDYKKDKYYVFSDSWENDADNYQDHINEYDNLEEAKLAIAFAELFESKNSRNKSQTFGNYYSEEFPYFNLYESVYEVIQLHPNIKDKIKDEILLEFYTHDYKTNLDLYHSKNLSENEETKLNEVIEDTAIAVLEYIQECFLGYSEYFVTRVFAAVQEVILVKEPIKYKKIKL